jgi:hypothetical protein
MIDTNLEGFGLPHEKSNFTSNLMLQKRYWFLHLLPLIFILIKSVNISFAAINKINISGKTLQTKEK